MKDLIKHYVITHMKGTKANQVVEISYDDHDTLTLGRTSVNDIQFDPDMDTMVSREHAEIVRESTDPLIFKIVDKESMNGVWVNENKIKGSHILAPGDLVEMGKGGPAFIFDLNPRPEGVLAATREMEVAGQTIEFATIEDAPEKPEKTTIGKQTFERAMATEQKKSNRKLFVGIAALLLILAASGFVFWKNSEKSKEDFSTVLQGIKSDYEKELDGLRGNIGELEKKQEEGKTLSAVEIAALNEERVVRIEATWHMTDPSTNEEIYHQYVALEGQEQPIATYIVNRNGRIEPFLVPKSQATPQSIPLGSAHTGSGFVVSEDGFILTNRHVSSAWHTRFSFGQGAFPGILLDAEGKPMEKSVQAWDAGSWVPSEATMLAGQPLQGKLIGKNSKLDVVFANDDQRRTATVEAISTRHDAAMIKTSMPIKHSYVELLDNYDEIKTGQQVTVMGYPGVSPDVYSIQKSSDVFKQGQEVSTIPIPTVTPGTVGRLIKWSSESQRLYSTFGDAYQLSINATGGGNSGGPMFDDKGRVIGIFFAYQSEPGGPMITFAVPIKYGLELMGHKNVL